MAHYFYFKNVEGKVSYITIDDNEIPSAGTPITGGENPCVLSSLGDDDKTTSIKGKKMVIEFLSDEFTDVSNFSDGYDGRFPVEASIEYVLSTQDVILRGSLLVDDNSEAFQPKPNIVTLTTTDGLGLLKDIELSDAGSLPIGHYSIMQYIMMCLSDIPNVLDIYVVMNIFEEDSDDTASHTFADIFLDALTFEKDVDSREDKYTVLTKILDAFGCFISYENTGWWIVRWDEYDRIGTSVLTHRAAKYSSVGSFVSYELVDLTKVIAHDQDAEYEGYFLSQDTAVRRFQRKAKKVVHTYNFQQPREVPCNVKFTRGDVIDDVLPLKTYEVECWTTSRGFGANETAPNVDAEIWVRYNANDNEDERYLVITYPLVVDTEFNYVKSEGIPIEEKDKFNFSFDYSAETDNAIDGPASIGISCVVLYGDDSSVWVLGDNATSPTDAVPEWKLSNADLSVNFDYYQWFFDSSSGSEDYTEFRNYSIESPPAPVSGNVVIHFFAANQLASAIDTFFIRYNNVQFEYIPFINGTYGTITGQEVSVSTDELGRTIEHEMFISDSPRRLYKGALKKFDGSNYVLTENWNDFNVGLTLQDSLLSKHTVFQWWNQFRKTRTVIETDVQGIKSDTEGGRPGLIHRYKIIHGDQEDKYFMMTRLGMLNIMTCGWQGVFVETSDMDGDRNYDDTYSFKFIQ